MLHRMGSNDSKQPLTKICFTFCAYESINCACLCVNMSLMKWHTATTLCSLPLCRHPARVCFLSVFLDKRKVTGLPILVNISSFWIGPMRTWGEKKKSQITRNFPRKICSLGTIIIIYHLPEQAQIPFDLLSLRNSVLCVLLPLVCPLRASSFVLDSFDFRIFEVCSSLTIQSTLSYPTF